MRVSFLDLTLGQRWCVQASRLRPSKRFRHHWHNAMVLSDVWHQNKASQTARTLSWCTNTHIVAVNPKANVSAPDNLCVRCRGTWHMSPQGQHLRPSKRFRHHWHNAMVLSGAWRQNKASQSQALSPTDEKAAGKSGKKGQRPSKQKRRAMFFSGVWTPPRPKLSLVGARTSSR